MPGTTTSFGWPKPLSSDPIAQGADTIGQALDGIDAQFFVPVDKFMAGEPYTSWPLGTSVMRIASATTAAAGGWPITTVGGTVMTVRMTGMGYQLYFGASSTATVLFRWYGSSPGVWQPLAGAAVPTSNAAGTVSGAAVTANQLTAVPVTFPAGRFTTTPRVMTQILGNTPQQIWASVAGASATGFTANVWSTGPVAASLYWYAIQGAT